MAGDIKLKYGTSTAFTQTNLDGIASSSTWVAGWTSVGVSNTSTLAMDYLVSGQVQVESAALAAGEIRVSTYAAFNDTPTWPDVFSAGTEGTEGTATIHDTEVRDCAFNMLWGAITDTTASRFYPMPPRSIAAAYGGSVPPSWALFVAQSTTAALETTGDTNVFHYVPVLAQYT